MSHLGRTYTHLRLRPASVAVAPIVPPRFVSFARPNSSYAGLPFKPPPIRQRLRPLLPFFIYWCIITSLTVHSLRIRIKSREDLDKVNAKVTVLEGLIGRIKNGEKVGDDEVQRELEMVGLRERRLTMEEEGEVSEGGDVGWMEAIFGRKTRRKEDEDERAVEEWAKVIQEATSPGSAPPPSSSTPTSISTAAPATAPASPGLARRAPSSSVYL